MLHGNARCLFGESAIRIEASACSKWPVDLIYVCPRLLKMCVSAVMGSVRPDHRVSDPNQP